MLKDGYKDFLVRIPIREENSKLKGATQYQPTNGKNQTLAFLVSQILMDFPDLDLHHFLISADKSTLIWPASTTHLAMCCVCPGQDVTVLRPLDFNKVEKDIRSRNEDVLSTDDVLSNKILCNIIKEGLGDLNTFVEKYNFSLFGERTFMCERKDSLSGYKHTVFFVREDGRPIAKERGGQTDILKLQRPEIGSNQTPIKIASSLGFSSRGSFNEFPMHGNAYFKDVGDGIYDRDTGEEIATLKKGEYVISTSESRIIKFGDTKGFLSLYLYYPDDRHDAYFRSRYRIDENGTYLFGDGRTLQKTDRRVEIMGGQKVYVQTTTHDQLTKQLARTTIAIR